MRTLVLALIAVSSLAACGSDTYTCCYNKLSYACSGQETLHQCAAGDIAKCDRQADHDSACN